MRVIRARPTPQPRAEPSGGGGLQEGALYHPVQVRKMERGSTSRLL